MSPYRSARIAGQIADPSRARLGLVVAALGSLACFASLAHSSFVPFTEGHRLVLLLGSSVLAIMVAYSAIDAPAGRTVILVSAAIFGLTFVYPRSTGAEWRHQMQVFGWPIRYLALSGIACGLLVRLRRTRPGTSGALLRLAAIISAWWAVQWLASSVWPDADRSARPEVFSRSLYVFLALGMLDMRRWVGAVPREEPVRTPVDAAREIATTRLCLALVSIAVALAAQKTNWHSEWTVIATVMLVAMALAFFSHVSWLFQTGSRRLGISVRVASTLAFLMGLCAFDMRELAAFATCAFGLAALSVDAAVARFARARGTERGMRSAFLLASGALVAHVAQVVLVLARLREL